MWAIAAWFVAGSRLAKTIAFIAVIGVLTAALILGIETSIQSITQTLPSEYTTVAQALLPRNLSACVSVIITAHVAKWVYNWNVTFAKVLAE